MAGRKWEVEQHPQRKQIVKAIVRGDSFRNLTKQFGISIASLSRYLNIKLVEQFKRAKEKGLDINSESLKSMVQELIGEVREFLKAAKLDLEDRKPSEARKEAIYHIEEWRKLIETFAKLEGQLQENTVININPVMIQVEQVILEATVGYPEVRKEIVERFKHIEGPETID